MVAVVPREERRYYRPETVACGAAGYRYESCAVRMRIRRAAQKMAAIDVIGAPVERSSPQRDHVTNDHVINQRMQLVLDCCDDRVAICVVSHGRRPIYRVAPKP